MPVNYGCEIDGPQAASGPRMFDTSVGSTFAFFAFLQKLFADHIYLIKSLSKVKCIDLPVDVAYGTWGACTGMIWKCHFLN